MKVILPPANATIIHCLYVAQKARCFHCYQPMIPHPAGHTQGWQENGWTREHVVPKAKGGKDHKNIVLAHAYCNLMRGVRRFDATQLAEALRVIDAAWHWPGGARRKWYCNLRRRQSHEVQFY